MRCLLFYSNAAGRGFRKAAPYVIERLQSIFDELVIYESPSKEEGRKKVEEEASNYDVLVVAGGDGTFNNVINGLSKVSKLPIVGYINTGTLGDVGKNYGLSRSIKKDLDVIERGKTKEVDLIKFNDSVFAYMCAAGSYSDIAYVSKSRFKKVFRRLHYYILGFIRMLRGKQITYTITANNEKKKLTSPFVMVANGEYIGGFRTNKHSSIDDGQFEVIIPKKGLTNGLFSTLSGRKCLSIKCHEATIVLENDVDWCLDGEKTTAKVAKIENLQGILKIFA